MTSNTDTRRAERVLDRTFEHIKNRDVPVSDTLMDRIMLDADQVLAAQVHAADDTAPPPRRSLVSAILDAIGGWPSFGGLAAATVAGVWLGVSPPDALGTTFDALGGGTIEVPVFDGSILSALEG